MKKITKKISLTVKTGLHIGIGNDKLQIGGVDSAVIKDPINKLPYIPGSSLKGKIRCLLEVEGEYEKGELNDDLNKIFGSKSDYLNYQENGKKINEDKQSPTRVIFRDLFLCENFKLDDEKEKSINYKELFLKGQYNTEFKTEIVIDRKKGTASQAGPRTIERIPPEIVFQGEIIIRYINDSEIIEIENVLKKGFELLNNDYLGGSGSRGYGAVEIKFI